MRVTNNYFFLLLTHVYNTKPSNHHSNGMHFSFQTKTEKKKKRNVGTSAMIAKGRGAKSERDVEEISFFHLQPFASLLGAPFCWWLFSLRNKMLNPDKLAPRPKRPETIKFAMPTAVPREIDHFCRNVGWSKFLAKIENNFLYRLTYTTTSRYVQIVKYSRTNILQGTRPRFLSSFIVTNEKTLNFT